MIDWSTCFDKQWPESPASDADIEQLASALRPLNESEIQSTNQAHRRIIPQDDPTYGSPGSFDAGRWIIPNGPFPPSYISLLRWSNGGCFVNGERSFNDVFASHEVRDMLLGYEIPEYMSGAVPIAFDGGGNFYLFDMRRTPVDGEYPIVFTHAGDLGWHDAVHTADTFLDMCLGRVDPYELSH